MELGSVFDLGVTDILIIVFLLYVIHRMFIKKNENHELIPRKKLPPFPKTDMTVEELRKYNGVEDERILMALCGKIFDVTSGKSFYGPDGPYGELAGHDATRALATMDIKKVSDDYDNTEDLTDIELNEAKSWLESLQMKYPLIGHLLAPGEKPTDYQSELSAN